jgi:Protein kinase domain/AAA ATPase domain
MSVVAQSVTGRYAVEARIGQGGMGAVYRVADLHSGTELALKRLHTSQDEQRNRKLMEMFQQEFRTLAQLAHPNVVAVFDFGNDELGPYYTMELLHGESLRALAPLPWPDACALLRDVCSAVALLHSRRMLHRDLSPTNVHRTREGRAKLIDFGAMAPMGLCRTIVGTPPLIPPEALLQQPLDARADLYALGGTLYFALTGKHAYPAHDLAQLHALWRAPPAPPSTLAPGIPAALDALVLSLLSLERTARPSNAAEVLDRLSAIARLPRAEQPAVSRAYLSTPGLVGRAAALSRIRLRLAELHAGRSGVLAIEGATGTGRSRMLDSCVLEAKLAGIDVVRASAADAIAGSYGTLSALARQLEGPREAEAADACPSSALSLLRAGGITHEVDRARRPELQGAFRDRLKAVARVQPVLVAVDDVERCDEASIAALAAVAVTCANDRVLIGVSCTADHGAGRGPLAILLHGAERVAVSALQLEETQTLLASVFGEVPHLRALALRVQALAEGNPRGTVELIQYLLDHELVRYEMGGWVLPSSLAYLELPKTLSGARREKLRALSNDARELAEALSLAEGTALDAAALAELTSHGDAERLRVALDELVLAQILRREAANYVFEAQVWRNELESDLDPDAARAACGRIADALARRERDRLEIASFRMRGAHEDSAIDLLLEELRQGSRWNCAPPDYSRLLRASVEACGRLRRPRRDRMILLRELIKVGQDLVSSDLRDHMLELLGELRRDSGLDVWNQPGGPSDPLARLQYVADSLRAERERAPHHELGFEQLEAIIALGTLASQTSAIAARTGDIALLDLVPKLEPFYPLSTALARLETSTMPAARAVAAGRYEEARGLYEHLLEVLLDPTLAGLPEESRLWGIRALHYAIGNIQASLGSAQALVHAAAIENVPGWLIPAHSIRQVYELTMGNLRQAEHYRSQIELTLLQSSVKPPFSAAAVFQHVFVFAMSDNANGMRAAIPELEALASSLPGMRPFVLYARAEHARICGDHEEALAWLERAHELVRAGEHPVWPWLIMTRLFTLFAMARYEEARAIGLHALAQAEQFDLLVMRGNIDVPLALVEAKLGDFASACRRIDRLIDARFARSASGVAIGRLHEARARIALWMNNRETFEHHAQLCAQHLSKSGGEPALAAMFGRLLQDARQQGLPMTPELSALMAGNTTIALTTAALDESPSVRASLAACKSRDERARRGLELIVEHARALEGELFLLSGERLVLAASSAPGLGGASSVPALSRMLDVSCALDGFTAVFELHGRAHADGSRSRIVPLLLVRMGEVESELAGIATLHFAASASVRLPRDVATAVAEQLIAAGDATPRAIGSSETTVLVP